MDEPLIHLHRPIDQGRVGTPSPLYASLVKKRSPRGMEWHHTIRNNDEEPVLRGWNYWLRPANLSRIKSGSKAAMAIVAYHRLIGE